MMSSVIEVILMSICREVTPVSVPADLEIHVAQVVLVAEDIGQHREFRRPP